MSAGVRNDMNTLEQFFALTLDQEAELNCSLRAFFVKHGIPNSRPSQWLEVLGRVILVKHNSLQVGLFDKLLRHTAKLVDTMPVVNVDARLTFIHTFAVTKVEAVSNLQEEFRRCEGHLNEQERTFIADLVRKVPKSFAELSTKRQLLSEQLEPLRPLIHFLSRPQASADIESSVQACTQLGDVQRIISPSVQALVELTSQRKIIVREATVHRLQACEWNRRTSAPKRSRAIDAMRNRREQLIWLADRQTRILQFIEASIATEIINASIRPTQVVDSDGNPLHLPELFSAASKYKTLCLNVMRAEEVKHAVNLSLVAAQATFLHGSYAQSF